MPCHPGSRRMDKYPQPRPPGTTPAVHSCQPRPDRSHVSLRGTNRTPPAGHPASRPVTYSTPQTSGEIACGAPGRRPKCRNEWNRECLNFPESNPQRTFHRERAQTLPIGVGTLVTADWHLYGHAIQGWMRPPLRRPGKRIGTNRKKCNSPPPRPPACLGRLSPLASRRTVQP